MEKTELTRKYELMVIVDAKLTKEEKDAICKEATDAVDKVGGKVSNNEIWNEKLKLTFPIKKRNEGTYYLINFESEGKEADKIRPILRLKEKILRFAITKIED